MQMTKRGPPGVGLEGGFELCPYSDWLFTNSLGRGAKPFNEICGWRKIGKCCRHQLGWRHQSEWGPRWRQKKKKTEKLFHTLPHPNTLKDQQRKGGCVFRRGTGNRTKSCSVTLPQLWSKLRQVSEKSRLTQKSTDRPFRATHRHRQKMPELFPATG